MGTDEYAIGFESASTYSITFRFKIEEKHFVLFFGFNVITANAPLSVCVSNDAIPNLTFPAVVPEMLEKAFVRIPLLTVPLTNSKQLLSYSSSAVSALKPLLSVRLTATSNSSSTYTSLVAVNLKTG